jgi:uncharacterized membrane protein
MKTRTVMIGVVVMIVGLALLAGGVYGLSKTSTSGATFTQSQSGEYVSSEIASTASSVVVVKPAASTGGMVPAQDLGVVNSSNVGSFAVSYNSTAGGSDTYIGLRGDYYYIVFASSQPSTQLVVVNGIARTALSGLLVLIGFACVIAGIVVGIVGAAKKDSSRKMTGSEEEYYARRGSSGAPATSLARPTRIHR